MNRIEAPSVEGFTPVQAFSSMGLGYMTMRSPDGVRLDLSETGAAEADQSPHLLALLERMGDFIAEHDGYRDSEAVEEAEPGEIYVKANPRHKKVRTSVYRPDSAPDTIVKAYDIDKRSAGLQFYLGNWLQDKLAAADGGLRSPRLAAMFTSPGGHRTSVMEYIPGKTLEDVRKEMDKTEPNRRDTDRMVTAVKASVFCSIARAAGWRGRIIANDIRNVSNIIVEGDEALNPGNITGRELAIIDLPYVTRLNFPLQSLVLALPVPAAEATAQLALDTNVRS